MSEDDKVVYLVEMLNFDVAEAEKSHTYLMKRAIPLSKQTIVEIFATYEEAHDWVEKNSEWYKKNVADFHEFDIVCYHLRHQL